MHACSGEGSALLCIHLEVALHIHDIVQPDVLKNVLVR